MRTTKAQISLCNGKPFLFTIRKAYSSQTYSTQNFNILASLCCCAGWFEPWAEKPKTGFLALGPILFLVHKLLVPISHKSAASFNQLIMVNVLKFSTLFSFHSQMNCRFSGIHKTFIRIANREDPDLGLLCLSRPFWQATSVRNFRTFAVGLDDFNLMLCIILVKKQKYFIFTLCVRKTQ